MARDTVLILDTDKHATWTLKTLLEIEQYPVVVADTLEQAIKDLSEFQISGFVTEYRIEGVKTLETIGKLKEMSPETYVMMITDKEMKEDEYEEIMQAGIDDYFLKPIPIWKILVHLRKGFNNRDLLIEKKRLQRSVETLRPSKGGDVAKSEEALPG